MKLTHKLTLSLLALGLAGVRAADNQVVIPGLTPTPAAPAAAGAAPVAPAVTFTNEQLVETWGWFLGKKVGLGELEFTPSEIIGMVKGIQAAAAGKDAPYDLEKAGPLMDELMTKKQEVYFAKQDAILAQRKAAATAKNDAFFAKLEADNKAILKTPSGLRYQIITPGTGPLPKAEETVKVHYTGALTDGKVFDSSVQRNVPLDIPLNRVIPGWSEGLQKVAKGGKIKLYIPPDIGYGDQASPDIPASSILVFDVELLEILPPAPAPAMPALPGAPEAAPAAPAPGAAK
jgi:FKBP-type peptidyl-prolyl cis-trans isomerase